MRTGGEDSRHGCPDVEDRRHGCPDVEDSRPRLSGQARSPVLHGAIKTE
jgi:hypothetical protein